MADEIKEEIQKPQRPKKTEPKKKEVARKEYKVLVRTNFGSGFVSRGEKVSLCKEAYLFYKSKNKVE